MDQYAIYLRKSRADIEAEASGEGDTLNRHKKALLELAKKLGLKIINIYSEIVSGDTISSRPAMQELLQNVEQRLYAGVLVMDIDRLARGDSIDQGVVAQAFKYSNTKIITPVKTYDPGNEFDEEYFEFGLFMARREYKAINRRMQRGRLAAVKEGKYLAPSPPYGYKRKKLENTSGYTLIPHPEQADVIKLIFQLYTYGQINEAGEKTRLGTSLIAHRLNNLGVPPQKGKLWVSSSIRDILINPVYIGKVRWNWRKAEKHLAGNSFSISRPRSSDGNFLLADGLHEPIIDVETFDKAQAYMRSNPPRPVKGSGNVKNPLCGLVYCSICGRKMVRRPYKAQTPSLICPLPECHQVSSCLSMVEDTLLTALAQWLNEYKINIDKKKQAIVPRPSILQATIAKLDKELVTIDRQINKLHDLFEQEIYTVDIFLERSKILSAQKEQTLGSKKALIDAMVKENETKQFEFDLIQKYENISDIYEALSSPAAKNDLLKEVVEKVVYYKDLENKWSSPGGFTLEIYPKLPLK